MSIEENKRQILKFETKHNLKFPSRYFDFLMEINYGDIFEIENTGICMYSYSDLEERNQTYEIQDFEPNYLMIGQDGDMAYFINKNNSNDNTIYSNDLGALGSLEMRKEADNIYDFLKSFD